MISDALHSTPTSTHSTLYISDLYGWTETLCHSGHNGLLVQRPFNGQWDCYQADIDACHERVDLEYGLTAHVARGDNFAARFEAAVTDLLARAALPAPLSQQLVRDACLIGRSVASMCASAGALEVKLEIAGENSCQRWHQDNFVGRALTSYTGVVGTEYTSDENVNFWELTHCGNNDHIIRDPKAVKTIEVGDILFIKGRTYEGANPLVHKSPAKRYHADGRILNRLMLKVDVPTRQ